MKHTSIIALSLLASSLPLKSEIIQQQALDSIASGESLVAAAAASNKNGIRIEMKTNGQPTNWVHVFINIDGDETTGFDHHLGGASGKGLDLMLEGDIAYLFSGEDAYKWSWAQQSSMSLTRNYENDIIILQLYAPDVEISEQTKLMAVTYSHDYKEALDHLPRTGEQWTFTKKSLTGLTELPTLAFVEKKKLPARRPVKDLRQSFKEIDSYACYYGKGQVEALSQRDAVIIETKNQTPESIAAMQASGTLVIGYISIGEDDAIRIGDGLGYGGFDSSYFDRNQDNVPDKNSIWNSHYADARQPAWRRYFLERAFAMRRDYGVDGFFLDTIDTSELYKESESAMIGLIRELRFQNPDSIIINNRGFHTVEALGSDIDGVMFESFTASWNWDLESYYLMDTPAWDWGLTTYNEILKPAMETNGLVVLVLDYTASGDAPETKTSFDRAVSFGYVPEVSSIYLDEIYTVTYEGVADPKYLNVQTTQESITHTLDKPVNGFPTGTAVVPSSVYPGYYAASLVDGVKDKDALSWRKRAWASWEKKDTHQLKFELPETTSASRLRITWAWDNGQIHTSRNFRIEVRPEGQENDWIEVADYADHTEAITTVDLNDNHFTALRVFQEIGGGSSSRPNIMWIEQIELVQ